MNATKLAVASVVAASVIGVVSFAYAQTTTSPAAKPVDPNLQQPMSPATPPMDNTASSPRDNMPNTGTPMSAERTARPDRN
jgi:hypothetical protein